MSKTFPVNQDEAIEKLMEENRRLTVQKDTAQQMYLSAASFMNSVKEAKMQKEVSQLNKNKKTGKKKGKQ